MRLRGRPTLETLGAILAVFAAQVAAAVAGLDVAVVLSSPLAEDPWTVVTSVYAHAGLGHLLANVLGLALLGPLVARRTSRVAFHGYFLGTGVLAGVAEVTLGSLVGGPTAVLGASGAVFALLGYLLAGNVVSTVILDRVALSARAQVALFLAVAVLVALATGGPRSALFGHAAGLALGLLAGRARILDGRGAARGRGVAGRR